MEFDVCRHKMTQLIIKAGAVFRRLQNLPEENNITVLYNEAASLLGIEAERMNSLIADRLPAPHEMKYDDGTPMIPLRKCPQCGKDAMEIFGLCSSCQDAEGGKYRTKFVCKECQYFEKSEKHMVLWLQEMGVDFGNQSKRSLGIRTITDDGIK